MSFYYHNEVFNKSAKEIIEVYNNLSFSPRINSETSFCLYTTKNGDNYFVPLYSDCFNPNSSFYVTSDNIKLIIVYYNGKLFCNDKFFCEQPATSNITEYDDIMEYCMYYQHDLKKSRTERVNVNKALKTNNEIIDLFKNFYNEITNKHLGEHHCPNLDLELVMQGSTHYFFNLDNGAEVDNININNICLSSLYYQNTIYSNSKNYLDQIEISEFGNLDNFLFVQELIDKLKILD